MSEDGATVPGLFPLEVANVLARAERRGLVTAGSLPARVALIEALPITIDQDTAAKALRETLTLARQEGLTIHDAAYLELALRLGIPLATRDADLRRPAGGLGVSSCRPDRPYVTAPIRQGTSSLSPMPGVSDLEPSGTRTPGLDAARAG